MQLGFYFDQTRCCGCFTCIVACKDWNNLSAGPASWRRVTTLEKGTFPDLFVALLSTSCHHCAEPSCMNACPVEVIFKRKKDGVVVVDRKKCLGKDNCALCLEACPYDAPSLEQKIMLKCKNAIFVLTGLIKTRSQPVLIPAR